MQPKQSSTATKLLERLYREAACDKQAERKHWSGSKQSWALLFE